MRTCFHACLLGITLAIALPVDTFAKVIDHWRFDEVSGLVAADSGGLVQNNGTWQDAASTNLSWGPGLIGNAAILTGEPGSENVFSVGSIEADGVTQLSYSVWIKPNLTQLGNSGGDIDNKGFFTTGTATVDRGYEIASNQFWGATWQNQNRFRIDSTGSIITSDIYDGTETEPEWVNLVFTWDGTVPAPGGAGNPTKIYINGALDREGVVVAQQILDDGNWQIGRDRTFGGRTFGGVIDDLVVWDQVLDSDQVETIYQGGLIGIDAITALSLGVGIPGDVNDDTVVNGDDFEIIRQNFWQPIAERNQGDLIDNDFIDFSDYGAWRNAMQDAAAGAINSAQVPEPSSLSLLGTVTVLCVRRRHR
jgi:hypothetical protein